METIYENLTPTATNNSITECYDLNLGELVTGSTVMLICNYVTEQCKMNGLVGCVQKIVY